MTKYKVTAWAIVMKKDGFLPDLDIGTIKGVLHIHSKKKDALDMLEGIADDGWEAVQCSITYEV